MNLEGHVECGESVSGGEVWRNRWWRRTLKTYVSCVSATSHNNMTAVPSWTMFTPLIHFLFPLYSDEILLFRYTVGMPVWLEVLWHKIHLLYLTELPNAAVCSDWQAHTPVSATGSSSSLSNGRAVLTTQCQWDGAWWAEWHLDWQLFFVHGFVSCTQKEY